MTGYYTVGLIVIAVCCFATLAIWFVNRKQVKIWMLLNDE